MTGWLDATVAGTVIGDALKGDVEAATFAVHVESARSYVENRRPDLFVPVLDEDDLPVLDEDDEPVLVYTAPKHVVVAASLLAYRTYQARTTPAAELLVSDDLAGMLGIGKRRGLRFGGAAPVLVVPEALA